MGARKLVGALALIVALMIAIAPSAAFAQGSSADAYGGVGGQVQEDVGNVGGSGDGAGGPGAATAGATGEADSGSLPFTGLDLVLVVAGGLALLIAGVTIAAVTPRGQRS